MKNINKLLITTVSLIALSSCGDKEPDSKSVSLQKTDFIGLSGFGLEVNEIVNV